MADPAEITGPEISMPVIEQIFRSVGYDPSKCNELSILRSRYGIEVTVGTFAYVAVPGAPCGTRILNDDGECYVKALVTHKVASSTTNGDREKSND